MSADRPHARRLGATEWWVWQDYMLRSAGFPIDGLTALEDPELAAVADEHLAAGADPERWPKQMAAATAAQRTRLAAIAADPLFREAVTWQNPGVLTAADRLGRERVKESDRRQAERVVARYWQRYCAKNETIGFFGPGWWGRLTGPEHPMTVRPGPDLVDDRWVRLEDWALAAVADRLAADPAIRPYTPVHRAPQLFLDGSVLRLPAGAAVQLGALEAGLLDRADGRSAVATAAAVVEAGLARTPGDALLGLERLADKHYVQWGFDVVASAEAEPGLLAAIEALTDDPARDLARASVHRLLAARDTVARAAGQPDRLRAAMAELDTVFTAESGSAPTRRPGQMYAARSLCYQDTRRDVHVDLPANVLDAVAEPLAILLRAASWLCGELETAYAQAFDELYDDLVATSPDGSVPLADLWFLAQGLLFGTQDRPVDAVSVRFVARWQRLLGLDPAGDPRTDVRLTTAELTGRLAAEFPAPSLSWAAGRLHSPDLHLCATDDEAVRRGEFHWVLGELHAGWASFDAGAISASHPEPARLTTALAADLGAGRVRILYPDGWPRFTGRVGPSLLHEQDHRLAFTAARGAGLPHVLALTAADVRRVDGQLHVTGPDRSWPLLDVLSDLVAVHAVDGFKLAAATPHTPRVTIDRLVVQRRTWRLTCADSGLVDLTRDDERYLAVRALTRELGWPQRVYAKIGGQTKPVYVDLTSPVLVAGFAAMVRAEALSRGGDAGLTVSEMVPGPADCWLTDAAGRRYTSELRFQCVQDARC